MHAFMSCLTILCCLDFVLHVSRFSVWNASRIRECQRVVVLVVVVVVVMVYYYTVFDIDYVFRFRVTCVIINSTACPVL